MNLVCLKVKNIGPGNRWEFGVLEGPDGEDVVFFKPGGRKLQDGSFTSTTEERKPAVGNYLLCAPERQPDGRLRTSKWARASSIEGVR